ncbi:MAG: penicillin-binding protein 2 [Candidatus Zixiibacteriota bacterium]
MRLSTVNSKTKAILAGFFLFILISLLMGSLFYHQIIRHNYYHKQSENNRIRIQPIVPKRGLIYDRHLQVLTDNRLSFTVSLVPNERIENITSLKLAELLDMDTAAVEKRVKTNYIGKYMPAAIRRGLGHDIVSILEEQRKNYPGITYSAESVRRYDTTIAAGHFIGYVGEVSADEKKSESYKDYRLGSLIGKKGIEKKYDRLLRGIEGTDFIEVSAQGQIVNYFSEREQIPAVPGADLVLTIDKDLQRFITETFVHDTIEYSGTVVAIDPRNGEVLALASFPSFDPNIFSGVISPEYWDEIISDINHPLLNRPLAGLYPPGSTTKLLTAGAALELGLITPEYVLKPCFGGMRFGNRVFHCWDLGGHGKVNLYQAIEQSCDVYFYQVGQMLGVDRWSEYARGCGFGVKTGIDIPGELDGIVPNSKYYDEKEGKGKWTPYLVLNLAIGQGEFTITPIQLAQFYCGLANDGKVYRPHLLKEVIRQDGTVEEIKAVFSFKLPFSQKTLQTLNEALKLVVQGDEGTARGQRNKLYEISGKTGTAENPHGDNHSWFAAFAPSDDPKIAIVALVENAGHGSEIAAPLAAKIIRFYLEKSNDTIVNADDELE